MNNSIKMFLKLSKLIFRGGNIFLGLFILQCDLLHCCLPFINTMTPLRLLSQAYFIISMEILWDFFMVINSMLSIAAIVFYPENSFKIHLLFFIATMDSCIALYYVITLKGPASCSLWVWVIILTGFILTDNSAK